MPEFSPFAVLEKQKPIDLEIRSSERALGIENTYDRLNEASLFIDKKFLNYGIITGVTKRPERIFGDNAWADYLDGRLFAKEYGQQALTPEFVLDVHKKLTARSNTEIGGVIRNVGVIGGSFDTDGEPISLTDEQITAINSNPQLSFNKVADGEGGEKGHIVYPHSDTTELNRAAADYHTKQLSRKFGSKRSTEEEDDAPPASIREAVARDLKEICEWFNIAKGQDHYNPHILAGLLQQRLASLHPFEDLNGTLSRVLMNWSLENDGQAPSALEDPSADIYHDEESWIAKVTEGSNRYTESKKRQEMLEEAGIDDMNALFRTGQDQVFYQYIFQHIKKAPPLPTNGDRHNHEKYENFLKDFTDEMHTFQDFMSTTTTVHATNGDHEITQGGLITPEFMHFALNNKIQIVPEALREQLFSDVEVYRGGMIDGEVTDEKICQMFTHYTAVGTGYRALQRSHLPATSGQRVTGNVIQESLEYYNKMLAKSYFKKKHGDIPNPYTGGAATIQDLAATVQDHISGNKNIWNSPFASTSLERSVSASFAQNFGALHANNAEYGILFTAQVPREGTILTHGEKKVEGVGVKYKYQSEREVLLPGALIPAAITTVEIFDRPADGPNRKRAPKVIAKKEERDGQSVVVIEDRRGATVVRKTFTYNPTTYKYEFTDMKDTGEIVPAEYTSIQQFGLGLSSYPNIHELAQTIHANYEPALENTLPKIAYNIETPNKISKYNKETYYSEPTNEEKIIQSSPIIYNKNKDITANKIYKNNVHEEPLQTYKPQNIKLNESIIKSKKS